MRSSVCFSSLVPAIGLLWGTEHGWNPQTGSCQSGLLKTPCDYKGGRERRVHTGAGNFTWDLHSSENVGRCWILSTATYTVCISGPSFSVSLSWGNREEPCGFWSHTCFLPLKRRQGPWLEIATTRQPVEGTVSEQHGVILVSHNALPLLFILECLFLALCLFILTQL